MTEELHYVQGDTGPNPVFGLQNVSATAGATARSLASLATAYMRFGAYPTPATAYLVPATVAAGADAIFAEYRPGELREPLGEQLQRLLRVAKGSRLVVREIGRGVDASRPLVPRR